MSAEPSRRRVLIVLAIVQVFFATLPIAGKIILREVGSAALVFILIHALTTKERIQGRGDYFRIFLLSLLGVSLNQLLYLAGLERTTATSAQMLIVLGPAITLSVGMLRGTEQGTRLKWIGIALAASGALALVAAVPATNRIGNLMIFSTV